MEVGVAGAGGLTAIRAVAPVLRSGLVIGAALRWVALGWVALGWVALRWAALGGSAVPVRHEALGHTNGV